VKWSGIKAIFSLSKTSLTPSFSNSFIAMGAVISFARTISSLAFIISPGVTSFLFECAASIFSEIVIPINFFLRKLVL